MLLKDFMDLKQLQQIQDQFSDATGLAAIAVDSDGSYVTQGSNFTDFCMKYTRGCEEGARRCIQCDNECTGTYYCHAGLMDFSADIMVNGQKVGAIIGGQVLPAPPNIEEFRQRAREFGIDEDEYIVALKKVPIRSEKTIRAASAMLGNVVNQVVNLTYLEKITEKKIKVFDQEVATSIEAVKKIEGLARDLQQVASMEKILSINASIEAGRAGSAGVGFAIVAQEIGRLSGNSAKVYDEIQELIVKIKNSITTMYQVELTKKDQAK